jgi:hypothetical protein
MQAIVDGSPPYALCKLTDERERHAAYSRRATGLFERLVADKICCELGEPKYRLIADDFLSKHQSGFERKNHHIVSDRIFP